MHMCTLDNDHTADYRPYTEIDRTLRFNLFRILTLPRETYD